MARRLKKLGLAAAATLLAFGVCELGVRIAGLAPAPARLAADGYRLSENPRLGYEPVGGIPGRNSLGFRDREPRREKRPGVRRILVLGDSIADGFGGIPRDHAFPARLESILARTGHPTEVINFGVSGYNTLQEVELYKTLGASFDPDLVLVAYCLNDRQFVTSELIALLAEAARTGRSASRPHALLDRSHLVRYARHALGVSSEEAELAGRLEPYRVLIGDTVAEAFAELDAETARNGHRVLVVVFPQFGDPARFPEVGDIRDYPYGDEHRYVAELARRHGFDHLDLLEPFRRCAARGPIARDTYHPTAEGHLCAARAVAAHLAGG